MNKFDCADFITMAEKSSRSSFPFPRTQVTSSWRCQIRPILAEQMGLPSSSPRRKRRWRDTLFRALETNLTKKDGEEEEEAPLAPPRDLI